MCGAAFGSGAGSDHFVGASGLSDERRAAGALAAVSVDPGIGLFHVGNRVTCTLGGTPLAALLVAGAGVDFLLAIAAPWAGGATRLGR